MIDLSMISVVIPALNEEKHLPNCLSSLKAQKWAGELEVIVVDNGSTDNTSAVATSHGATVVSCPKKGVAYARQAGAEVAQGQIIAQADADTFYPPGWIGRIDGYFESHQDSAGLAGRYEYTDPAWWVPAERVYRRALNALGYVFFRWPASVSGANFAFRRSAFIQAQGYDPNSLYPDQWGIARRVSRYGRVDYDHSSVVITSPRRVAKPTFVIGYEIARNCSHVGWHFVKHCIRQIKKTVVRSAAT